MISGGMVIAQMALIHVVLAHYSVGAGFLIYGLEKADRTGQNKGIQRALDLVSNSVVYVNFVVGAITGVGIWFCISLFSADATQHLIQKFVWLWGTEWTFFAVEIIIGYLYYYNRHRISPERRLALAKLYLIFTWGSLVVITGILSYMLTSKSGNALVSWANPSAFPSVFLRTISSVTIACLLVMILVDIKKLFNFSADSEEKTSVFQVLDGYLRWFFLMLPFGLWYRATLPASAVSFAEGSSVPISMFLAFSGFLSAIVTITAWYAYLHKRVLQLEVAAILFILGIVATFSTEFVREGIRKPYVIRPILYSNGILAEDVDEWRRQTDIATSVLLVSSLYPGTKREKAAGQWLLPDKSKYSTLSTVERGEYLYRAQCSSCHTANGFNALKHLVRGWEDREFGAATLRNLHISKPFMPPFIGTRTDMDDLVDYALTLLDKKLETESE